MSRYLDGTKKETYDAILSSGLALVTTSSWFTPSVTAFYAEPFICQMFTHVSISVIAPRKAGFTVRKWSPLREYFDYKLLAARERGAMQVWTRRRARLVELSCDYVMPFQSVDISLKDSLLAFTVVVVGAGMSLLVLVLEMIVHMRRGRVR